MKMKKYKEVLIILGSFIFMTVCVFTGFIVADKNTRRVCFGDNSPILKSTFNKTGDIEIRVRIFGEVHKIRINLDEYANEVFNRFNEFL